VWLGRLAQLEERRPYKAKVAGSRPAAPTIATTATSVRLPEFHSSGTPVGGPADEHNAFVGATRLSVGGPADERNAFCRGNPFVGATGRRFLEAALPDFAKLLRRPERAGVRVNAVGPARRQVGRGKCQLVEFSSFAKPLCNVLREPPGAGAGVLGEPQCSLLEPSPARRGDKRFG
jgi:hypothetical protein